MGFTLRDPDVVRALVRFETRTAGAHAFVGDIGVQILVAARLGLQKAEPPAGRIEAVWEGGSLDGLVDERIRLVASMGFGASIEASKRRVEVAGRSFSVASPEHILGLKLLAEEVHADALWSCYVLLRVLCDEVNLEEVRIMLKRSEDPERQALLAELAYIAA